MQVIRNLIRNLNQQSNLHAGLHRVQAARLAPTRSASYGYRPPVWPLFICATSVRPSVHPLTAQFRPARHRWIPPISTGMDALIGGMGCDSAMGNPLGNLVDGFLDRARVAEQMGEGMVGGMAGPNMAAMGNTMAAEGAAGLGMFGPQMMGGGLDVNDFLAASGQYAAQDAAMAQMDAAFAQASMSGPSVDDFMAMQASQGPSMEDFAAFQASQGPSVGDFAAMQAMQGPSVGDFAAFQASQGPSVADFAAFQAAQGPSVADFQAFQQAQGPSVADFQSFQATQGPSVADFEAFQKQQEEDEEATGLTGALVETMLANPDPKFQNSKFLRFVTRLNKGELVIEGNNIIEKAPDLDAAMADARSENMKASMVADFAAFQAEAGPSAADFAQFQAAQGPSAADFEAFEREQGALHGFDAVMNDHLSAAGRAEMEARTMASFDQVYKKPYDKEYAMASDNPFASMDAAMAMAEGIRLFNEGDLAGAKMSFEQSVTHDATNSEGWRWLGTCNADSDDDVKSIMCLMKAVETDAGNLKAHLGLGVSYTNELENERALNHLRMYIEHHPTYAGLAQTAAGESEHDRVVDMFIQAAAQSPEDPQPRVVLGVLYNLSREYDKAVECFKAALEVDPGDYSLWNKLGATMANSAQSEESLHAYHQALETRPNYVRAWINVGMSFVNQGKYDEACQYYLRGLNLNPEAIHVWNYLRTALSLMDRMDLVQACDAHDIEAFKADFDF